MKKSAETRRSKKVEKIIFTAPDTKEEVTFYIVEETRFQGVNYLLVTESDEEEADAYILKEMSSKEEKEAEYILLDDDSEIDAVSQIFKELLEDIEIR